MAVAVRYQTMHLQSEVKQQQPIGVGQAGSRPTLLGRVVVNTGGKFVLTLYHGFRGESLAVIKHPNTGDVFEYGAIADRGLVYMLEGEYRADDNPYSVTVTFADFPLAYL